VSADPFAPPPWTPRPSRLWQTDGESCADPRVVLAAVGVGVVGALTLRLESPGSAYLMTGLGALVVALRARTEPLSRWQATAAGASIALLGVAAVRSAPWLVALCVIGSLLLGALAVVGARTWTGIALGAVSGGLALRRTLRWVSPTVARLPVRGVRSSRAWLVVLVTLGLVSLFGALFAAADPAYAAVLDDVAAALDVPNVVPRLLLLAVVTAATLVGAFLAHQPPSTDALAPGPGRPVRRWEWTIPLTVLDLLFLSFVLVQLTVLFGSRDHVLRTEGLTYAEYARHGFWELLVVTALTLVVIAFAVRTAPRSTSSDQVVVRVLLAALCLLALVVVASAVHRMSLYEQEYGFTRLRLLVNAVELALGAAFLLVLAAGARLDGSWLPRAGAVLGAATLLALAVVNPDAYIAEHNVSRYERTQRIDLSYLASLSPDAVPALDRLPAGLRACALRLVAEEVRSTPDRWYDLNLARVQARRLISDDPAHGCPAATADALEATTEP
jgi:hypothetical protein